MNECNKADHQRNPLELFEIFFTSITPVMTPIGIRSQGMQAIHYFWKQRFLNVFRGIPEDKGLDQFSDLPILWLSAWKHQQEKVEELEKHIVDLEQQMLRDSALATKAQIERNELQTIYTQQGINMLKMQKRVDALSKRLSEATGLVVEDLEQALKGDQYDEHRKKAEEAISKGASLTNHRIEL
ncbi:TPA: hypothetical protein OXM33_003285 [Acinetobacter baumannii]|nr:hypothetical protein [Acinetobacter baumannii]